MTTVRDVNQWLSPNVISKRHIGNGLEATSESKTIWQRVCFKKKVAEKKAASIKTTASVLR